VLRKWVPMKLINLPPLPVDAVTDSVDRQVTERVPKADMSERDPEFIARTVGPYRELARRYFRADVRGLDRIPEDGPILLVGNHSGGNVLPQVMVTTLAFARRFGPDRPFYQLAHNLVMAVPVLGSFLAKFGTIAANPDST
jgi:1-acyl-sn-glycerol-3-phosphate acyltransferase